MDDKAGTAAATQVHNNSDPAHSSSGLDTQGNFRVGDTITIAVRGEGLVLTQAHSGREVEVSEPTLQALLEKEYFTDSK